MKKYANYARYLLREQHALYAREISLQKHGKAEYMSAILKNQK